MEQRPFQSAARSVPKNPLAWIKVCGAERVSAGKRPFRDAVPFARALIAVDSARILWGTDWPHPNISKDMPNDGELVDLFAEFCPDPVGSAADSGGKSHAYVLDAPMIIDCHGHYTTAPAALQKFRDAQIAALKIRRDVPLDRRRSESATTRFARAWRTRSSSCSASAAPT